MTTITYKGNKDIKVNKIFKNIVSIELLNAILPIENIVFSNNSLSSINLRTLPYLVLNIPEITGTNIGTNQIIDNCFCKLVIKDKNISNDGERGTEVFIPISNEIKQFKPRPLDSLSKLSIELTTPQGETICSENDIYNISGIRMVKILSGNISTDNIVSSATEDYTVTGEFIEITLNEYFHKKVIQPTDLILFKNIKDSANPPNFNKFKDFIERPEGHYVVYLSSTNGSGYVQKFYISNLSTFNKTSGTFSVVPTLTTAHTDTSGLLINNSLQNTFTFNISTQEVGMDYTIENDTDNIK